MYKNFIALLAIMALLVIMRVHFLDEPFERDEGGYAYMAQRFLKGDLMYRDYWESRPPGIVFIYALIFKLYGENLTAIRVLSIYTGLLSVLLVYLLAEKLFNRKTGYLSALLYAIFSGGPLIQGSSANAEPFMILFTLLGIYLGNPFLAGVSFGLAFMVKQTAVDGLLAVMLLSRKRNIFPIVLGFFTAWIPAIFYLVKNNIFGEFIYAAFGYNLSYVRNAYEYGGWFVRLKNTFLLINRENSPLWFLGIIGLFMLRRNLLIFFWSIFGVLMVSFGGRFFPHYFIQLIPVLCILSGYSLSRIGIKIIPVLILLTAFTVFNQYRYYLVYSPYEVCQLKYPAERFVLAEVLARKIRKETRPEDCIYVWGSEPEIYFYSGRRCPTRYIHNHFIRMNPRLAGEARKEIIDNLNEKKPKIIVNFDTLEIFPELRGFISDYYELEAFNGLEVYNFKDNIARN